MATQFCRIFYLLCVSLSMIHAYDACCEPLDEKKLCAEIAFLQRNQNDEAALHEQLPTVRCPFKPTKYERILLTQLRDRATSTKNFRKAAQKLGEILVEKVIECLPTTIVEIETPIAFCEGEKLSTPLELVSIMRSGDALLDIFVDHFPKASVSKILIQRDEETAKPIFKYMKLSSTIGRDRPVVITEPMIATGGTLGMVIFCSRSRA